MGLELATPKARALLRAYLRSVLGSDRLLAAAEGIGAPDPVPTSWVMVETAARQAIGQRKVALSLEQNGTLARDAAAYACHAVMANTQGWLGADELSRITGRGKGVVQRALTTLERAGLAKVSGAKACSPLAGRFVAPLPATPSTSALYAALRNHRSGWSKQTRHAHYLILRARKAGMEVYASHLADAVALSAIYGDVKASDDSDLYLVEARVAKLFQ